MAPPSRWPVASPVLKPRALNVHSSVGCLLLALSCPQQCLPKSDDCRGVLFFSSFSALAPGLRNSNNIFYSSQVYRVPLVFTPLAFPLAVAFQVTEMRAAVESAATQKLREDMEEVRLARGTPVHCAPCVPCRHSIPPLSPVPPSTPRLCSHDLAYSILSLPAPPGHHTRLRALQPISHRTCGPFAILRQLLVSSQAPHHSLRL